MRNHSPDEAQGISKEHPSLESSTSRDFDSLCVKIAVAVAMFFLICSSFAKGR